MDLQARITAALSDFDDLLRQGVSIEAALEVAAVENGVSIEVLKIRASRTLTLEERRSQALEKVELEQDMAERTKVEAMGSLFVAAYDAEKRHGLISKTDINQEISNQSNEPIRSPTDQMAPEHEEPKRQPSKRGQLKFDY